MSIHRQYFPDEEDETGAAKALMRLQDTYQLDSEAFSRGKLPGTQGVFGVHLREHERSNGVGQGWLVVPTQYDFTWMMSVLMSISGLCWYKW